MKSYNFEHGRGAENAEEVVIHRKNKGFRLGTKIVCLLLALLIWLVIVNVDRARAENEDETQIEQQTEQQ